MTTQFQVYRSILIFFFIPALGFFIECSAQSSPLDLLPVNQATHVVASTGDWSDPAIWEGRSIPGPLAKILIPPGKTLVVDGEIDTRIKIIRVQGKLAFSTASNTALKVETVVQDMSGSLEIGTASNPLAADKTCRITIIDEGDIQLRTAQWEKGFIMMGHTTVYGAKKDAWIEVSRNPLSGDRSISLSRAAEGWLPGDRIVITGTDAVDPTSDEVVEIASVSGRTINLRTGLSKSHSAPRNDLKVHVANLSRNIIIESENGSSNRGLDRGHMMFMSLNVDMNNVRLHKMGRTRKDRPVDDWFIDEDDRFITGAKTNIRGRYSIHFHRGGVNPGMTPAYVRGCVVEDDPGWAYTSHSAFVHFDNNVSYNVIGGGFQTEAGDEIGSFTNNIAIRTVNPDFPLRLPGEESFPDLRENAQDFAFQGDGFWVHGGGVRLIGNVASGCSGHGFIYWPEGLIEPDDPMGTYYNTFVPSNLGLPNGINISEPGVLATGWASIAGFESNQVYSATIGLATYYLHTTFFFDEADYDPNYISSVHSTFDGFVGWNLFSQGIQLNYTERVTFKNVTLINDRRNAQTTGLMATHFRVMNKQVFENLDIEGFATGLALPPQGQVTVTCGYLKNGVNMSIPSTMKSYRDMLIHNLTTEADNSFSEVTEIKMTPSFSPPEDKYPAYFLLTDKIILDYGEHSNQRLYFNEQDADYIPLPFDDEPYTFYEDERIVLSEFAVKSNRQLQRDYRMSFGGSLLPGDAIPHPGIDGGQIAPWRNDAMNVPSCIGIAPDQEVDEINDCIRRATPNLVMGPLPSYIHPVGRCATTSTEEEDKAQASFKVFPNPTLGLVSISGSPGDYQVSVFDGKSSMVRSLTATGSIVDVDLTGLPPGMYFLQINNLTMGASGMQKVIKLE